MLATVAFEAVETVCSAPVEWLLLATSIWVNEFLQFYFNGPRKWQISAGFSLTISYNLAGWSGSVEAISAILGLKT